MFDIFHSKILAVRNTSLCFELQGAARNSTEAHIASFFFVKKLFFPQQEIIKTKFKIYNWIVALRILYKIPCLKNISCRKSVHKNIS